MKFIIYTPFYDENIGGIIVLHKLGQLLRELGIETYLWHDTNPYSVNSRKLLARKYRYWKRSVFNKDCFVSPYILPIARKKDLQDAIVIYPEVTAGNPLMAKHVVRWLLYKPGAHTGVIDYDATDLFFYYLKEYDYPELNKYPDNQLFVLDYFRDIYRQTNSGRRSGSCYMVRKGKNRNLNLHPSDAIQVDGLSHKEMAKVFNRCEYLFSYDLYTMYSAYASVCGCKSIVLPVEGMSIKDWRREDEGRFGVAYGLDDVSRAEATRAMLVQQLAQSEQNSLHSVRCFIQKCGDYFGFS